MQLLNSGVLFSLFFVAISIQAELSPDIENVCLQTETYDVIVETEVLKPVTEKRKKMCWSISKFFSCEKSVTKMKIVKEPQVVQRTKIVPKCCDGYAEEKGQVNKCSPVCLNGCKNGKCVAPSVCACSPGFYGAECEHECLKNFWGNNCANKCDCSNNGNCDNISGGCHCDSGWRGKSCELPCQEGYYGHYCEEKCNCSSHLCNHKTGECITTTTETFITTTMTSITEESTAETSVEIYQPAESSTTTTISDEETSTSTIKKDALLEGTKHTVSPEMTSDASNVTIILGNKDAIVKMTKELNKNEKETKTINLEELLFSRDTEDVTEISDEAEEISTLEISGTKNISVWRILSEGVNNFDKNETNNLISEREKSPNNERTLKMFRFILSLSVTSGVSFLIFIIAAQWIISKHRKKTEEKTAITGKKEKLFQSEEQIKFQTENFFWVNNCTKNPLPDIELYTTPILGTFKPVTPNKGFISKEKEIE